MQILILLIPLSIVFLAFAVLALFWAIRNRQFDDMESPAWRIIYDDQQQKSRADARQASAPDGEHPDA